MSIFIITKRELQAFFVSPIAYIVGAVFAFITGLFFIFTLLFGQVAQMTQVFQVISILLLFIAPILTMRLLAEEARSGTLELLMTAPVHDWEVILGKFLATFIFYVAMLVPTFYFLALLVYLGQPDIPVTLSGYLGVVLLGMMLISVGVLTSALSANQIVAAALGILFSVTLWLMGGFAQAFQGPLGRLLEYASMQEHYTDFVQGLVSMSNIAYFLSVTAIALFLAVRVLQVRRWR